MNKFSDFICKHKIFIIILSLALLIPAIIGMEKTKINYDILVYLPQDIETVKGENILTDDFNMGSFATIVTENMSSKDMLSFEDEIKKIDGVEKVISIYDITGTSIPVDMLPKDAIKHFKNGEDTLLVVTFKGSTSDEKTLEACENIRKISDKRVKMGGMSSMVLDTMNLSNSEVTIYVIIAVILCIIVLSLALDSYIVPFLLLANIGIAILYNMGTNIFLGNISYITKAISAVLQLGVTTDFSIFLYHKYEHYKEKYGDINKAMSRAIGETMTSIIGSSLTTIAGFLALCTMNLTLGKDIGIVMAKGVLLGLLCVLTVFPALLLAFNKLIEKTSHKELIPQFTHLNDFLSNHYKVIFIIFLVLLIPAWYGQNHAKVYYNLDKSLPDTLESSIANKKVKDKFGLVSPEMILASKDLSTSDTNKMADEIKKVKGIDMVLNPSELNKTGLDNMLSDDAKGIYETDKYKMILINSKYKAATNELNNQITDVNKIIKKYDSSAILAGEGPLMKDLVTISNTDFNNVNYTSLAAIFVILIFVLKSISLPVLLVFVIEFAIFVNMGIPYYTGSTIPFVASIVIGTIQLGATIDYTILMTTKYLEERKEGKSKHDSIKTALDASVSSIFVSGMCFFAATFGVGVYSKLDMISSLCTLISRGALISMLTVIMVLPSFLIIFDKLIIKTTKGFKNYKGEGKNMKKNIKKLASFAVITTIALSATRVNALTKNETVYSHLNTDGKVKSTIVNEHLTNIGNGKTINDRTNLTNILNVNGNEKFDLNNNMLSFENKGNEIYYQGETNKDTPIDVSISYKLDGKDIKLNDLLGKSGRVDITLNYTNNSYEAQYVNGKRRNIYTPFVVTMATNIPTKNVKNVTVTNGKVESTGNNNIVVAIATPGLSKSLNNNELDSLNSITISYDVKNFKLNTIYNVALNKIIDNDDLDAFDKVDDVYSKVATLSNSSKELVNGTKTLESGAKELENGAKTASEGSEKLVSGSSTLNSGLKSALDGAKQLESGAANVDQSLSQIIDGLKQGETDLNTKATTMNESIKKLDELEAGNNTAISKLEDAQTKYTNEIAKKTSLLVQALSQSGLITDADTITVTIDGVNYKGLNIAGANFSTIIQTLHTNKNIDDNTYETLSNAKAQYDGNNSLIYVLGLNNTSIETTKSTLNSSLTEIKNQLGEIDGYLTELQTKGTSQVRNGAVNLTTGLEKLYGGSTELSSGISTLDSGLDTLYSGTNTLSSGTTTLREGMEKFDSEGIDKINELVNGDLKENVDALKKIINAGNDYQTFTMKNDGDKSSTKFVMTVDAKEKKAATKKKVSKKKTNESIFKKIFK